MKTLVQITEHYRTIVIEHAQFSITFFLVPHLTMYSVVSLIVVLVV